MSPFVYSLCASSDIFQMIFKKLSRGSGHIIMEIITLYELYTSFVDFNQDVCEFIGAPKVQTGIM